MKREMKKQATQMRTKDFVIKINETTNCTWDSCSLFIESLIPDDTRRRRRRKAGKIVREQERTGGISFLPSHFDVLFPSFPCESSSSTILTAFFSALAKLEKQNNKTSTCLKYITVELLSRIVCRGNLDVSPFKLNCVVRTNKRNTRTKMKGKKMRMFMLL